MIGQGLTVLAIGAGGGCSDIFFFSPITSLFFLLVSGMDGWTTCGLSHFQQTFSDIRTIVRDGLLYAIKSHLKLRRSPPQAGLESGTARSASPSLTRLSYQDISLGRQETARYRQILSKTTNHMFQWSLFTEPPAVNP